MAYVFPDNPVQGDLTPDGLFEYNGTAWVRTSGYSFSTNYLQLTPAGGVSQHVLTGAIDDVAVTLDGIAGQTADLLVVNGNASITGHFIGPDQLVQAPTTNEFITKSYFEGFAPAQNQIVDGTSIASIESTGGPFTVDTAGSEWFRIGADGRISTAGELSPDAVPGGITFHMGANSGYFITAKATGTNNPFTTSWEADTFGGIGIVHPSVSGLEISGLSESEVGLNLKAYAVTPSSDSFGPGVFNITGFGFDGVDGTASLAATENLLVIANNNVNQLLVKGNGDIASEGGADFATNLTVGGNFTVTGMFTSNGTFRMNDNVGIGAAPAANIRLLIDVPSTYQYGEAIMMSGTGTAQSNYASYRSDIPAAVTNPASIYHFQAYTGASSVFNVTGTGNGYLANRLGVNVATVSLERVRAEETTTGSAGGAVYTSQINPAGALASNFSGFYSNVGGLVTNPDEVYLFRGSKVGVNQFYVLGNGDTYIKGDLTVDGTVNGGSLADAVVKNPTATQTIVAADGFVPLKIDSANETGLTHQISVGSGGDLFFVRRLGQVGSNSNDLTSNHSHYNAYLYGVGAVAAGKIIYNANIGNDITNVESILAYQVYSEGVSQAYISGGGRIFSNKSIGIGVTPDLAQRLKVYGQTSHTYMGNFVRLNDGDTDSTRVGIAVNDARTSVGAASSASAAFVSESANTIPGNSRAFLARNNIFQNMAQIWNNGNASFMGNVGVGQTPSATHKLAVTGSVRVFGTTQLDPQVGINYTPNVAHILTIGRTNANTESNSLLLYSYGGTLPVGSVNLNSQYAPGVNYVSCYHLRCFGDGTERFSVRGDGYTAISHDLALTASTTETRRLDIGLNRTGDGVCQLKFHSSSVASSSEIVRYGGTNGTFYVTQTGTGALILNTVDAAAIMMRTNNIERIQLTSNGDLLHRAVSTEGRYLTIGYGRAGDGASYINLIGDATYNGYGMQVLRSAGENGYSYIYHRGTGRLVLQTLEAGGIDLRTTNITRMWIQPGGDIDVYAANTDTRIFKIGTGRTGDGASALYFQGDTTYVNYGLAIQRNGGANANSSIASRGTGALFLNAIDAGTVQLATTNTTRFRVEADGRIGTGGVITPDVDPGGVCIHHGSNLGAAFGLKNTTVAHPFTSVVDTNTYFSMTVTNGANGGANLRGFCEAGTPAIRLTAFHQVPPNGNTAYGCVDILGRQSNGSGGFASLAADMNLMSYSNNGTINLVVKANGDIISQGGAYFAGVGGIYSAGPIQTPNKVSSLTPENVSSISITTTASMQDEVVTYTGTGSGTFTIDDAAYPTYAKINFLQFAAGSLTIAVNSGSLHVEAGVTTTLAGQYAMATAWKKSSGVWILFGNLEAA